MKLVKRFRVVYSFNTLSCELEELFTEKQLENLKKFEREKRITIKSIKEVEIWK